jgi:hypothetical protein
MRTARRDVWPDIHICLFVGGNVKNNPGDNNINNNIGIIILINSAGVLDVTHIC